MKKIIECLGDHLGADQNRSGAYRCLSKSPEGCNYANRTDINRPQAGYLCKLAYDAHWNRHNKHMENLGGLE